MSENQVTLYGRHPVVEALESGQAIEKVFLLTGTRGELEKTLRHLCKERGVPLQHVPREKLDYLANKGNHQGVAALIPPIPYQNLDQLLASLGEKGQTALLVLLDGVTDVRNFGAIARSAEICGAHALVVPQQGSASLNAEAIKASAGALTRIPVCRESSLHTAVDLIKSYDIRILAAQQGNSIPIFEAELTLPSAVMLGSEGKGIQPAIARLADQNIHIPQIGLTDSFNVSVAAGIILYETMRQRIRKLSG